MSSDESDLEYEEIRLGLTNGERRPTIRSSKKLSPIKRPLLPPPSIPVNDGSSAKTVEPDKEAANEKTSEKRNREYLKTLDEEEVGRLMGSMSLGQYREKILSEHITGEILLECDEAVLQEDIGVASRIHRIKIMKMISGQHSAKALLDKRLTHCKCC